MACHLPPTIAMVTLGTLPTYLLGLRGWPVAIVAFAVLAGQLTVGWSNDYLDADLDRRSNREIKPVVRDSLDEKLLILPMAIAATLLIPLSFAAAGLWGGLSHIVAVACAWSYNLFFARTIFSWAPYTISFALVPIFIYQSVSRNLLPTPLLVLLAGIAGIIIHLINAYTDIDIDRKSEIGGVAVVLGKTRTIGLAAFLTSVAFALLIILII